MTKTDARVLFAHLAGRLLSEAEKTDARVLITCVWRSPEEQAKLKAAGKSTVTKSQHQEWLAIDLVEVDEHGVAIWENTPSLASLGDFWKKQHELCRWGGDWKSPFDPYHFEVSRKYAEFP